MCRGNDATAARPAKFPSLNNSVIAWAAWGEIRLGRTGLRGGRTAGVQHALRRGVNHQRLVAHFQLQHLDAVVPDVDADGMNLWPV